MAEEERKRSEAAADSWSAAFRRVSRGIAADFSAPFEFLGGVVMVLPQIFKPRGIRRREFYYYLDLCGARSLVIVVMISLLMGAVLALQSALQLRKFGAEIFVVDLVGFAVFKEFGPLMVAMVSLGRAGSAFAAEIGTMKVNEEISALQTLGIRPEAYLVLPKLLAMLLAMPILTIIGDLAGLLGGLFVGVSYLGLTVEVYFDRTFAVLDSVNFLLGVVLCIDKEDAIIDVVDVDDRSVQIVRKFIRNVHHISVDILKNDLRTGIRRADASAVRRQRHILCAAVEDDQIGHVDHGDDERLHVVQINAERARVDGRDALVEHPVRRRFDIHDRCRIPHAVVLDEHAVR